MDQTAAQDSIFSDRVLIDGKLTLLTFHSDRNLRWSEDGRARLLVQKKELLSVSIQASGIVLKCVVVTGSRFLCFDNIGNLVRKSFVIDPLSQKSLLRDLHQKLLDYLNSLPGLRKRLEDLMPGQYDRLWKSDDFTYL